VLATMSDEVQTSLSDGGLGLLDWCSKTVVAPASRVFR